MVIEYPHAGLPSDAVLFRIGYDGSEPEVVRRKAKQVTTSGLCRCAVALNTYYEEIRNEYYVNKALIGMVQACLFDLGLLVVVVDAYREAGFVPAEPPGTLVENEDYYLVTQRQERVGELYLWQFDVAGGNRFYTDRLIIDIILPEVLVYHLSSRLHSSCLTNHVAYEERAFPEEDQGENGDALRNSR